MWILAGGVLPRKPHQLNDRLLGLKLDWRRPIQSDRSEKGLGYRNFTACAG